jgi:histidyl-tRNA synthetase
MIFEAVIVGGEEANLGLGSVAAGGRYDNLIGMFSKNSIPSAGGSLGIERIFNILD